MYSHTQLHSIFLNIVYDICITKLIFTVLLTLVTINVTRSNRNQESCERM